MAEAAKYIEQHARSLSALRRMGAVAMCAVELDYAQGDVREAYEDFSTALGENLATDREFNESLTFAPMRSYDMVDGRVVTASGQDMVELVKEGLRSSQEAAKTEPEMRIHAVRDQGDVITAERVNGLEVGELYAVVSLDPKKALQRNPDFWEGKGYREGMAVLQVYYRASESELRAGAYSIKRSNREVLADIFQMYGVHIPHDETDNKWIRHGIHLDSVGQEDAEEFGKAIVEKHSREVGLPERRLSVTDLIRDNQALVKACFDNYIRAIATSLATGSLDTTVQSLAHSLLQSGNYAQEDSASLIRVANGVLHEGDMALMEERVRYGLVEELRKLIPLYLGQAGGIAGDRLHGPTVYRVEQALFLQDMNQMMVRNVTSGMTAGRSYGGCAAAGGSDLQLGNGSPSGAESQDVFGGKDQSGEGSEKLVWKKGVCRVDNCPTRPGQTEVAQCSVCRGCQRWFDRGRDPAKLYKGLKRAQKTAVTIDFDTKKETKIKKESQA